MQGWRGWSPTSLSDTTRAPTWDEWRERLRCVQSGAAGIATRQDERRPEGVTFSARQLARLTFVRWLYRRGYFGDRLTPAASWERGWR